MQEQQQLSDCDSGASSAEARNRRPEMDGARGEEQVARQQFRAMRNVDGIA